MKKKCKICDHACHCYGKGYNLNTNNTINKPVK